MDGENAVEQITETTPTGYRLRHQGGHCVMFCRGEVTAQI